MTIELTLWPSLTEPKGKLVALTWEALAKALSVPKPRPLDVEKPNLPGWSPAKFREDRRAKDRVELVTALVLDVDKGNVPLEQVKKTIEGYRAVIHSTRRATPGATRWRVVLAVSRAMSVEEHALVWQRAREAFGTQGIALDEATKDPSRFWFMPCEPSEGDYVCEVLAGEAASVESMLVEVKHASVPEPVPPPFSAPVVHDENEELARITMTTRKRRASAYLMQAEPAVAGDEGHKTAMRVVTAVVRGFALSEADARDVLSSWNARCEPPWNDRELAHKISEAARVGAVAWGVKLLEGEKPKAEAKPEPKTTVAHLAPELPFDDIWTTEPDAKLVIPALGIAPGPVHLVTGTWYTGKTLLLATMGLCVAAGVDLFGLYRTQRGPWLHFDHEMGRRHLKRYVQRLRAGLGIDPEELRGRVSLRVLPLLNLRTANAADLYTELLSGYAFCTIDPLRAAAPGADENKSEFREYLDMLAIVSDRTGCSIVVLHHGGKPTAEPAARRNTGRGTSAIDDAAQTKFVLSAEEKGAPMLVTHEKTRELTKPLSDFYLEIVNEPEAVRLVHRDIEEMALHSQQRESSRSDRATDEMAARIVTFIATLEGGEYAGSKRSIFDIIGGNEKTFRRSWAKLELDGVIVERRDGRRAFWRAIGP